MTARAVADLKPIHLQVLSKIFLAEELCVDIELMTQVGREEMFRVRHDVHLPGGTLDVVLEARQARPPEFGALP